MATLSEHFKQDFAEYKTELSEETITLNDGKSIRVSVQVHHDDKGRVNFMSVLRPEDLSSEQVKSFYDKNIPELRERCVIGSKIREFPKHEPSNDVFIYTNVTHDEGVETIQDIHIFKRGSSYCSRMVALNSLIEDFVKEYKEHLREQYEEAALQAEKAVEKILKENDILTIVSHRAKDPERLRIKLKQRANPIEKPVAKYIMKSDIINDMVDLAGVRVALYFPGDRGPAAELISKIFDEHKERKEFPDKPLRKTRERRFAGYRATHLRLKIRDQRTENSGALYPVEVQIASVIMHAWSEVEHDLDYKQLDGVISDLELELLDQLNGLALAGEISLEQLQVARKARLKNRQLGQDLLPPPAEEKIVSEWFAAHKFRVVLGIGKKEVNGVWERDLNRKYAQVDSLDSGRPFAQRFQIPREATVLKSYRLVQSKLQEWMRSQS
jgi:ppGpp synthetase/RelA/SpoT-type nucleotidyltranferase